jgi:predicted nucleic acid-binding Zn ribbon protein
MPLYVYRVIRKANDSRGEETFEVRQQMSDPPLTKHPETGEPVERVLMPPNISVNKLGNASLSSAGLTKYVKTSDGSYERQAGNVGPKVINPNDL